MMLSAEYLAQLEAGRQKRFAVTLALRAAAGYQGCHDCVPREHGLGSPRAWGWWFCPKHRCDWVIPGTSQAPEHGCTRHGWPSEWGQFCNIHAIAAEQAADLAAREGLS